MIIERVIVMKIGVNYDVKDFECIDKLEKFDFV